MNTRRSARVANIKTQDLIPNNKRQSEPNTCEKVSKTKKRKLCATPVFVSKKKLNQSKNPPENPDKAKCSYMTPNNGCKNAHNMCQLPTTNQSNVSTTLKTKSKRLKDATQTSKATSTPTTTNKNLMSKTHLNLNFFNNATDSNYCNIVQSQPYNYSKENMNAITDEKQKRKKPHIEILENILLNPIINIEQLLIPTQDPFSNINISKSQTLNNNSNDDSNRTTFSSSQAERITPKHVYRSQRLANKQRNNEDKQNKKFEVITPKNSKALNLINIPTVDLTSDAEKKINTKVVKSNPKKIQIQTVVDIQNTNPQVNPQRNIADILDFTENSKFSAQCLLKSIPSEITDDAPSKYGTKITNNCDKMQSSQFVNGNSCNRSNTTVPEIPCVSEKRILPNNKLVLESANIEIPNIDDDFEFESTSSLPSSVTEFIETIFESDKIIYHLSQKDISLLAIALNIEVDFLKSTIDKILKMPNGSPIRNVFSSSSSSLVQCSQSPDQRRFASQSKNN